MKKVIVLIVTVFYMLNYSSAQSGASAPAENNKFIACYGNKFKNP
jgi:hypothetical protein